MMNMNEDAYPTPAIRPEFVGDPRGVTALPFHPGQVGFLTRICEELGGGGMGVVYRAETRVFMSRRPQGSARTYRGSYTTDAEIDSHSPELA